MDTKSIDAIANAVLYEGYMLYPYRASSVKNRQRFNFGVLYPPVYCEAQTGSDTSSMQTECLMEGNSDVAVEIAVRFLKLISRREEREPSEIAAPSWQEALECNVAIPVRSLKELAVEPLTWPFSFPAGETTESVQDGSTGRIKRRQEFIQGEVEINAKNFDTHVFRLSIKVKNLTSTPDLGQPIGRDDALVRSMVSAHVLLGVVNGQFISLLDPPENLKEAAAGCKNVGAWPILVGAEGSRDTMLASSIILYDYPQIAPESPGDLFDGTEIDEILALRILTMTDDEKREMRQTDERARKMLERTEALSMEHLMKLHGTLRELRSFHEEAS